MLQSNPQAIQQQTTLNTVPQLKEIQWISLNKHIFLQPKKGKPWPTTSPQLKNTQARLIKKEKRERFWFIPTTSNQAYFEGQYKITKLAAYPISKVPILDERERNWINLHERGQYRQSVEKRQIRQQQLNKKKSSHWEQSTSSSRSNFIVNNTQILCNNYTKTQTYMQFGTMIVKNYIGRLGDITRHATQWVYQVNLTK